jgi:hypothetical protein
LPFTTDHKLYLQQRKKRGFSTTTHGPMAINYDTATLVVTVMTSGTLQLETRMSIFDETMGVPITNNLYP